MSQFNPFITGPGNARDWAKHVIAQQFNRHPAEPAFMAEFERAAAEAEFHPLTMYEYLGSLTSELQNAIRKMPEWKDSLQLLREHKNHRSPTAKELFRYEYRQIEVNRFREDMEDFANDVRNAAPDGPAELWDQHIKAYERALRKTPKTSERISEDVKMAISNMPSHLRDSIATTFLIRFMDAERRKHMCFDQPGKGVD